MEVVIDQWDKLMLYIESGKKNVLKFPLQMFFVVVVGNVDRSPRFTLPLSHLMERLMRTRAGSLSSPSIYLYYFPSVYAPLSWLARRCLILNATE